MKGLTGFFIAVERVLVYPMNDPFLTGHLFLPAWSSSRCETQNRHSELQSVVCREHAPGGLLRSAYGSANLKSHSSRVKILSYS